MTLGNRTMKPFWTCCGESDLFRHVPSITYEQKQPQILLSGNLMIFIRSRTLQLFFSLMATAFSTVSYNERTSRYLDSKIQGPCSILGSNSDAHF